MTRYCRTSTPAALASLATALLSGLTLKAMILAPVTAASETSLTETGPTPVCTIWTETYRAGGKRGAAAEGEARQAKKEKVWVGGLESGRLSY